MRKLTGYLNALPQGERKAFCDRCGTSEGYLRKSASLGALLREKLCALVELHSGGVVTRIDLRPDDWAVIWPELVSSDEKQAPALAHQSQGAIKTELQEAAHA